MQFEAGTRPISLASLGGDERGHRTQEPEENQDHEESTKRTGRGKSSGNIEV